jgi:APA family basic amino acid/polyamine antiporter
MSLPASRSLVRGLGLMAATSITVAGVIGTGVFLKARVMTCNVGSPGLVLLAWVVAGALSIAGSLTYAELGAMMPEAGGEYAFVRAAYGRFWAFVFGWMRFFIAGAGGAAALAAGLAIFGNVVTGGALAAHSVGVGGLAISGVTLVAMGAIAVVTLINCAAVAVGGQVASTMAVAKIVLISGLGVAALTLGGGSWAHFGQSGALGVCEAVPAAARGGLAGFGAAMFAALWAYNGWNETSYIAGEVKDPHRNLPIAFIAGIGIVMALYCFVNLAYAYVLSPLAIASVPLSSSVATEVAATFLGPAAVKIVSAALVVSIFSALQVMTLLAARVPYAMASDGLFLKWLAELSPRTRVPVRALMLQAVWACVLVLSGSFDALTDYAMFAILGFVAMVTASVFVLRRRDPDAVRPYRTWGYPVTPALFLLVTALLLVNTITTAPRQALAGVGLLALGLPFYWYWTRGEGHS